MTNYFYDTEFLEDGKTIELISIGIYCEDGRELYMVNEDMDTRRIAKNNWLMANVMNSIDHDQFVVSDADGFPFVRDLYITDSARMTKPDMAKKIKEFTYGTEVNWWNWYGAYDHVALCQIFGPMIELPEGLPWWSNDIKMLHKLAGYPRLPRQPEGLHNALADAKFNKVRYDCLWQFLQTRSTPSTPSSQG